MNRVTVGVLTALLAAAAAPASSVVRTVHYTFAVDASGAAPQRVFVDRAGAAPLALTSAQGGFSGVLTGPPRLASATLRAVYPDGEERTLPVRLAPFSPNVAVTFFRDPRAPCADAAVRPLEAASSNTRANLKSYFKARDLADGRATATCGSKMMERVAAAWVERSYALAVSTDHIAFDHDAAERLRRVNPKRTAYVDDKLRQVRGREQALNYELQKWAQGQGDFALALAVNQQLQQQIGAEPAAARLQQLTSGLLTRDAAFLQSLGGVSASGSVAVPASRQD